MSHSVIFCGTPDIAADSLQALLNDAAYSVTLVITQPDRPVGRKQELTPSPVKTLAIKHNLPVFQPENINNELLPYLAENKIDVPDYLVAVAYGKILKQPVLDLPKVAPINVHYSLLPRWRGASPVEHAILAGDKETGVTVQVMSLGLDEGPILSVQKIPIDARDTSTSLRAKLSKLGAKLLVDTLKKDPQPQPSPQPQKGITICGKLSRNDAKVHAETMTAEEMDRCVRALNPWPSVMITYEGHEIKVLDAALEESPASIPLRCASDTTLHLIMVQEAGRKPLQAREWKRGLRI